MCYCFETFPHKSISTMFVRVFFSSLCVPCNTKAKICAGLLNSEKDGLKLLRSRRIGNVPKHFCHVKIEKKTENRKFGCNLNSASSIRSTTYFPLSSGAACGTSVWVVRVCTEHDNFALRRHDFYPYLSEGYFA